MDEEVSKQPMKAGATQQNRFTIKTATNQKLMPRQPQVDQTISDFDPVSKSQISNIEHNLDNLLSQLHQKSKSPNGVSDIQFSDIDR